MHPQALPNGVPDAMLTVRWVAMVTWLGLGLLASSACDPVPWYVRNVSLERQLQPQCLREAVRDPPGMVVIAEHDESNSYAIGWRSEDETGWLSMERRPDGHFVLHFVGAVALRCRGQRQLHQKEIADALFARITAHCAPAEISTDEPIPPCP